MSAGQLVDMFVLDSLANDIEDLDGILRILNSPSELGWRDQHPALFTAEEVVPAVLRGIRGGDIEACVFSGPDRALVGLGDRMLPDAPLSDVWYRMTPRGRIRLNSWEAPPLRDSDSSAG